MKKFLVATPFRAEKSSNIGDALISHSAKQLIAGIVGPSRFIEVFHGHDPTSALDANPDIAGIIAPGFPVQPTLIPTPFAPAWFTRPDIPFIPVGASSITMIRRLASAYEARLSDDAIRILRFIGSSPFGIAARDTITLAILTANDVTASMVGDCAMYDLDFLGVRFHKPASVGLLAFTPARRGTLVGQSLVVMRVLADRYPSAKRVLYLHALSNVREDACCRAAPELGYEVVSLAGGDVSRLDVYKAVDLHVGYRVHAHLASLRFRRPSVLISEDSRGLGFGICLGEEWIDPEHVSVDWAWGWRGARPSKAGGLLRAVRKNAILRAAFRKPRLTPRGPPVTVAVGPSPTVSERLGKVLNRHESTEFREYDFVADRIDSLFRYGMQPFLRHVMQPESDRVRA